jgi:hypothetical protein
MRRGIGRGGHSAGGSNAGRLKQHLGMTVEN